jgi:hypothetical protein
VSPSENEQAALLPTVLGAQKGILLLITIPLAVASAAGIVFTWKAKFKRTYIALLIAVGLVTALYFHVLSPKALRRSGGQKKEFCERATAIVGASNSLRFLSVKNSVLFYMRKNSRPLTRNEALSFLEEQDSPFLITTEGEFLELSHLAGFEIALLEESDYLVREKQKYVLLGRPLGANP